MKVVLSIVAALAIFGEISQIQAAVLHGPVTNAANNHVYFLLSPASWTASEAEAVQLGGHLATVNDEAESLWLREVFGTWGGGDRGLWIGLNDARSEGNYQWASGDPVSFRFWRRNYPIDQEGTRDYVFIDYPSSIYPGAWRNTFNENFDAPGLPISGVVEIVPGGEPVLSLSHDEKGMRVDFTGTLESSPGVTGPWTTLTNVPSPFRPTNSSAFHRARGPEIIFDRNAVIPMKLEGPFQVYFEKAFAGMPDGIIPPVREKPWFEGEVALFMPGLERPIDVRVRGNSSLQECPFPKLKFKVSRSNRANTPFFGAREIKVGTHCAEGGRGPIGRLRDERATWREAVVYEVMAALELVAPRVRRAEIDYLDTSSTNAVRGEAGWFIKRKAMLLDDIELVAERLGGRALDDEEVGALTNANFNAQLITDLRLLHALVGNWDWALSVDGSNLWNTDVVELPGGELLPVAGDFDLCSWVTEEVRVDAPWDFLPDAPPLERRAKWEVGVVSGSVPSDLFEVGKQRFNSRRTEIENLVNTALIDEVGRTNAIAHIQAFYGALNPPPKSRN